MYHTTYLEVVEVVVWYTSVVHTYSLMVSLHIRSMWETTVIHKQVPGWTVNFGPNFPDQSLLRNTPPSLPFRKTSDLGWPKFTPEYPPLFGKLQIWDDQSLLWNIPPPFRKTSDLGWPKFTPEYPPLFGKLQIWDDQSLLRNIPPISENFQIWDDQCLLQITPPPQRKLSESPDPRFSEYRDLLHVETLSNPDNY